MVRLENLTKTYRLNGRRNTVVDNVTCEFPSNTSVALLGRNGAGKSSLLKIIAGTMDATSGRVMSNGTISWPVGFSGSFHPDLTGKQNARFISRIYGIDTKEVIEFVDDFAELGQYFDLPVRSYSSGMRSRLAFGVSMAIPFETYLVDEVTSVGDASFRQKSKAVFLDRVKSRGAIVVTHSMMQIKELCTMGAILENGKLSFYDDIDQAIKQHRINMKVEGS